MSKKYRPSSSHPWKTPWKDGVAKDRELPPFHKRTFEKCETFEEFSKTFPALLKRVKACIEQNKTIKEGLIWKTSDNSAEQIGMPEYNNVASVELIRTSYGHDLEVHHFNNVYNWCLDLEGNPTK